MVTKWLVWYRASHPYTISKTESMELTFPLEYPFSFYQEVSLYTCSSTLILKSYYLFLDQSLLYRNETYMIGLELE